MFFDVEVPTLLYQGTLPWMFRTLDQNDLGLASALETLREAYRAEVRNALMDAMLDYSRGLSLETGEWLRIAARRLSDDPRLAPTDTDARTVMIRVRGADLTQFLAGQISREEARERMDVKVF